MRQNKKNLDFELNLVPFIGLLSVCICALLLSAVWTHIGSMNVKQATGGQSAAETEKKPLLWVFLGDQGEVSLDVREASSVPAALRKLTLAAVDGQIDIPALARTIDQLKEVEPSLRTALIQPKPGTTYETIIELMDWFKKAGLNDLGVVPL